MSSASGLTRRETAAIVRRLTQLGWRVVPSHDCAYHYLAYPPDPRAKAIGFSHTSRGAGRRNVFAAFRRAGVELDPSRLHRKPAAAKGHTR